MLQMKVAHTTCKPHEVKKCLKTLTNVSVLVGEHTHFFIKWALQQQIQRRSSRPQRHRGLDKAQCDSHTDHTNAQ